MDTNPDESHCECDSLQELFADKGTFDLFSFPSKVFLTFCWWLCCQDVDEVLRVSYGCHYCIKWRRFAADELSQGLQFQPNHFVEPFLARIWIFDNFWKVCSKSKIFYSRKDNFRTFLKRILTIRITNN